MIFTYTRCSKQAQYIKVITLKAKSTIISLSYICMKSIFLNITHNSTIRVNVKNKQME